MLSSYANRNVKGCRLGDRPLVYPIVNKMAATMRALKANVRPQARASVRVSAALLVVPPGQRQARLRTSNYAETRHCGCHPASCMPPHRPDLIHPRGLSALAGFADLSVVALVLEWS